jgi:hypothetical protein
MSLKRETLHVLALSGAGQQDLWRRISVIAHAAIFQPGGCVLAFGSRHD